MSTGTRQDWARLVAHLRREGKAAVTIAEQLRHDFDLGPLAALRHARGWSQHDAAREWTRRWPTQPKAYKDFSSWETGRHTPSLGIFDNLAQLYSCDLADLLADRKGYRDRKTHADEATTVGGTPHDAAVPTTAPGDLVPISSRYGEVGRDDEVVLTPVSLLYESQELDVDALASLIVMSAQRASLTLGRREVLSKLSAALALAAAAPVFNPGFTLTDDDQQRAARVLDQPGRLDSAMLGHTESIIVACRRQADLLGPQAPLQTALAQRSLMAGVLPEAPSSLRSRTTAIYAEICQLAGWLLFNLGDYRSAMSYYDEARTCAHEAEDVELVTYVLCTMSHLATWGSKPRVGIDHAVAAAVWAERSESPHAQAYAADVSVRAYVATGQHNESRAALEREHAAYNLIAEDTPTPAWWYFFNESFPWRTEAEYALRFGETDRAHRAITRSLELVDKANLQDYAFRLLFRAEAYSQGGEINEACHLVGDVAELTASNTSKRLDQRITQLRAVLAERSDSQAVRHLDERLATYGFSTTSGLTNRK